MTADERAALRALAEKATPGPWEARGDSVCIERSFVCHAARMYLIDRERDAAYIAAANPAAIKALLTALMVIAVNLLVDVLYGAIDPRIRHPRV